MNNVKVDIIVAICINSNKENVGPLLGRSELSGAGIVSVSVIGNNILGTLECLLSTRSL